MPVLPLVGSTITEPGFKRPFFSAESTMLYAMRSLTLAPGLYISSFAITDAEFFSTTFCSFTIGVSPTSSRTLWWIFEFMLFPFSGAAAHVEHEFHMVAVFDGRRVVIQFLQNVFVDLDGHELGAD